MQDKQIDELAEIIRHKRDEIQPVWDATARCRCGKLIGEPFEKCEWHRARAEQADRDADNIPTRKGKACGHHPDLICGCGVFPEVDASEQAAEFFARWVRDADNVPSDRLANYAPACEPWERFTASDGKVSVRTRTPDEIARAVMAVADREQATLRAENERWRGRADRRLAEAKKAEATITELRAEIERLKQAGGSDGTH